MFSNAQCPNIGGVQDHDIWLKSIKIARYLPHFNPPSEVKIPKLQLFSVRGTYLDHNLASTNILTF